MVLASESLAKVQHPDPDLLPMPTSQERDAANAMHRPLPSRHFAETAAITPEERAAAVGRMVAIANRHKLTTAGTYSNSESIEGIFNSRGLNDWHTQTSAEVSVTMIAGDSSGWQKTNSPNVRDVDAPALGRDCRAEGDRVQPAPKEIPAGKYTVILEPAAVLDIVGFMFWDFSGQAILDERSFLNNRIGTQLFGENMNIWDDVSHPLQSGAPFDGEGMRRQRVPLVEKGIVEPRGLCARHGREDEKVGVRREGGNRSRPQATASCCRTKWARCPSNIVFAAPASPQTVER